ncbi:hypothetical protein RclHR1_07720007 [Rhizophagus clarus]|uniref:Sel1-like repeat protein n=1 Tax=Rhizophagus clarus TaxID=94130 RepID=A0A2Z6S4K3_9GLOM|nr:hypothetical protein RclHR1_07720007 [Rhizophagus clarus]GET02266.1 Sel1-like repeat protein [Rhizophagus clarus]
MSDNIENDNNNTEFVEDSDDSNVFVYPNNYLSDSDESNSIYFNMKYIDELLQELYTLLLNLESDDDITNLYRFVNNFLFEYDLKPNDAFKAMKCCSQYISRYSSLIGYFNQHGIGCEMDDDQAFEIFSNSVKNNHQNHVDDNDNDDIRKLNEIILQYFYILFLYEDVISYRRKNYNLHVKDAEKGDNVSQYYVGNCYRYGTNIKQDYKMAIDWYLKSSEGGNIKAIYELGNCCDCGCGVTRDEKKAFELYLKSAEGGYKKAIKSVGFRYMYGNGTLKDENKAFEWHLRAAKKGNGTSQYFVANHYFYYDEEKGFYWIRKAAISGNVDAQFELAEYYLNNSINKNEGKAFKWYLKLANDYESRAVYSVAKCYRDGIGIEKNSDEAATWFRKYTGEKDSFALNDFLNSTGCYSI